MDRRRWLLVAVGAAFACRSTPVVPAVTVPETDCAAAVADGPKLDLLADGTAHARLVFDHRRLIGRVEERTKCVPAKLDGTEVRLEAFGNMSSQVCAFPKLILHLGGQRVVLITHCNEREAVGTHLPTGIQVHGHDLAYRLSAHADVPVLRTRKLTVSYVDEPTNTAVENRPAFFLEHLDDMLVRTNDERVDEDAYDDRAIVDVAALARFHLFQILIDNRDWRVLDLTPVEGPVFLIRSTKGTHNAFLVKDPSGRVLPVPFDLELSGFVGIPPGIRLLSGGTDEDMLHRLADDAFLEKEPWAVRWSAVRLLHFYRRFEGAPRAAAIQHFLEKKDAIEKTIADSGVPEHNAELARLWFDAFYRALPLVAAHAVTVGRVDLYADASTNTPTCEDLPPGTPVRIDERSDKRVRVHVMQRMRLDEKDAVHMCKAMDGWMEAASVQTAGQ